MERELLISTPFPSTAEAYITSAHLLTVKALQQVFQPITLPSSVPLGTQRRYRDDITCEPLYRRVLLVLSKWEEHRQEEALLDAAEGKKATQTQRAVLERKRIIPDEEAFNGIQRVYPMNHEEALGLAQECCQKLKETFEV